MDFDIDDIFNLVVKWTTIWAFVGLAATECRAIEHLDLKKHIFTRWSYLSCLDHPINQLLMYQ
jgi:hypothetical protein